MTIFEAAVLAVIQGLTEFLPISSSAHLALAPWLFGWKDQGLTFDIALHFGTLCAVLIYFFKDWLQLASQAFGVGNFTPDPLMAKNRHLLWWLAVASLPVGVVGLLIKDYTETVLRNPYVMGTNLILFGILMGVADARPGRRKLFDGITFPDAMTVGFAQALALIPGVSRSGVTLTAGLFRNIDRAAAARFSFLLSTPATVAAAAKAFLDFRKAGGMEPGMELPFAVGILVSGVTGLAVIAFFLNFLRTRNLRVFVIYRVVFGIIVIALAILRGPH